MEKKYKCLCKQPSVYGKGCPKSRKEGIILAALTFNRLKPCVKLQFEDLVVGEHHIPSCKVIVHDQIITLPMHSFPNPLLSFL